MYLCIKINKTVKSQLDVALKYFGIMAILNNLELTETELHIIAFMLVKGNINAGGIRKEFLEWYPACSKNYLTTALSILKKKGFIIKDGRRVILNPSLLIKMEDNIKLQLNISSEAQG